MFCRLQCIETLVSAKLIEMKGMTRILWWGWDES